MAQTKGLTFTQGILVPCYVYAIPHVHNLAQGKNTMSKLEQFKTSLTYIKKSGKVLANHVQLATVDLANHVKDCGDWSRINDLDKAISNTNGLRVLSFREYIKDVFTGLKYDEKAQVWLRKAKKKPVVIDEKVLNNDTWFSYTTESVPTINYDKRMQFLSILETEAKAITNKKDKNAKETGDEKAYNERVEILRQLVA